VSLPDSSIPSSRFSNALGFELSKKSVKLYDCDAVSIAPTRQDFDYHFGDFALPRLLDVNVVRVTVIGSGEDRLDL
jgi:hypothetical protein